MATAIVTERWLGGNGDFFDEEHWSRGDVPDENTAAVLGAGNYAVSLNYDVTVASLAVARGVTLALTHEMQISQASASVNYGTITLQVAPSDRQSSGSIISLATGSFVNKGVITGSLGEIDYVTNNGLVELQGQQNATNSLVVNHATNLSGDGILSGGKWAAHGIPTIDSEAVGTSVPATTINMLFEGDHAIARLSGKAAVLLDGANVHIQSATAGGSVDLGASLTAIDAGSSLSLANQNLFSVVRQDGSHTGLDVSGTLKLSASRVSGEAVTIEQGGLLTGSGRVQNETVVHGTVRAEGTLSLTGHVTLDGTLSGAGTINISSNGMDVLSGARISADAHLNVQGVLDFKSSFNLAADAAVQGSIALDGPKLTLSGDTALNFGGIYGGGTLYNAGAITAYGGSISVVKFVNAGTVTVIGETLDVSSPILGGGSFSVNSDASLRFGSSVAAASHVGLDGGTLLLLDAHDFHGLLTGLGSDGSKIDLSNFADATEKLAYTADADGVGGLLHVVSGGQSAYLHFDENVVLANFSHQDDGNGGSILTYHDNQVPQTVVHDATLGF